MWHSYTSMSYWSLDGKSEDDKKLGDGTDIQRRTRKPTEKGLAYLLEMKGKRRDQVFRELKKKAEHIKSLMIEDISRGEMNSAYAHWLTIFENWCYICDEYSNIVFFSKTVSAFEMPAILKNIENCFRSKCPKIISMGFLATQKLF